MSATVIPPSLSSSTTVLFATRAAAEAFFANFTVAAATPTTEGVVKTGASLSYTHFTVYGTDNFAVTEVDGVPLEFPLKDTFDELRTKVIAVSAGLNTLIERLRAAGLIES